MSKPIIRRQQARRDVVEAIDYYKTAASEAVALRFVDALEAAVDQVSELPAAGAPRFWDLQGLSGLRSSRLPGFPHLLFYVEEPDRIVVWRVLHPARDLSAQLSELLHDESE